MADASTIHIDKAELEAHVERLHALRGSGALLAKNERLKSILAQSKGSPVYSAQVVVTITNEAIFDFYLLVDRTIDFLTNTKTSFIQADENLKEQINAIG
jgi:hypothetical protein